MSSCILFSRLSQSKGALKKKRHLNVLYLGLVLAPGRKLCLENWLLAASNTRCPTLQECLCSPWNHRCASQTRDQSANQKRSGNMGVEVSPLGLGHAAGVLATSLDGMFPCKTRQKRRRRRAGFSQPMATSCFLDGVEGKASGDPCHLFLFPDHVDTQFPSRTMPRSHFPSAVFLTLGSLP